MSKPRAVWAMARNTLRSNWLRRSFRLLLTVGGLGWIFLHTNPIDVWKAMMSVPPTAYVICLLWTGVAFLAATARWRLLLRDVNPALDIGVRRLFGLTLMASFFANLLPGALGGDAARAYALRASAYGTVPTLAVVIVERGLSFAALLGMAGMLALMSDLLPTGWAWGLVLCGAVGLPMAIALFLSLARARIRFFEVPAFSRFALAGAFAWSAVTQLAIGLALWSVVSALWPQTPAVSGLAAALLTQLAAIVPAVAGLGPGQALGSYLLSSIGVPVDLAVAATLVAWVTAMGFVVAGGLLYLKAGLGEPKTAISKST